MGVKAGLGCQLHREDGSAEKVVSPRILGGLGAGVVIIVDFVCLPRGHDPALRCQVLPRQTLSIAIDPLKTEGGSNSTGHQQENFASGGRGDPTCRGVGSLGGSGRRGVQTLWGRMSRR